MNRHLMTLTQVDEKYRDFVRRTNAHRVQAAYDCDGEILELVAEAGEVLGVLQKAVRKGQDVNPDRLYDELSDVAWGLYAILTKMGWSLEELLKYNVRKLSERRGEEIPGWAAVATEEE